MVGHMKLKICAAALVIGIFSAGNANAVPESGINGLTPNAYNLMQYIANNYPVHAIGGVRSDPLPDHPSGHALDLMVDGDMGLGDELYGYLSSHMEQWHIKYLLWRVPKHFNHVHVTVF